MRPLYEYRIVFTHPPNLRIEIPVVETTPCRAKNTALDRHMRLLECSPEYPNDNEWRVAAVLSIRQVGFSS